jgi:D-alanyl-D-alanine carboxypeptidase
MLCDPWRAWTACKSASRKRLAGLGGGYDPGTVRSRAPLVTAAALAVVCIAGCSPGRAVPGPGSQRPPTVAAAAPGARQAPATPSAAARDAAPPAFRASVTRLGPSWRWRLRHTWHRGCPQPLPGLALIRLTYWGFDHRAHTGELIVNAAITGKIIRVFAVLYRARYQIRRMVLPDVYNGSDPRSTNADNTSAFNCRLVDGTGDWSMHAYGLAVDINPCENVYIEAGHVDPPRCQANADRSRQVPGLIHEGGVVTRTFDAIGWGWGGRWVTPKDYQHFSSNGH